jgi:hypothetical protein
VACVPGLVHLVADEFYSGLGYEDFVAVPVEVSAPGTFGVVGQQEGVQERRAAVILPGEIVAAVGQHIQRENVLSYAGRGQDDPFGIVSAREWTRVLQHPYQDSSKAQDTHGHLRPTPVKVPPFSTFAVPFAWMTRRDQEEIANRLPDRLPEDREPPLPAPWVFGRQRQEALLTTFFGALSPGESLVFFYTKEGQPISDAINRFVGNHSVTATDAKCR